MTWPTKAQRKAEEDMAAWRYRAVTAEVALKRLLELDPGPDYLARVRELALNALRGVDTP